MKFRKKPVVIEAVQWLKDGDHPAVVSGTLSGMPVHWINTLEGDMMVKEEDWIITGVKGEHYPCRPDIFEATYEPADALAQPKQNIGALGMPVTVPVTPPKREWVGLTDEERVLFFTKSKNKFWDWDDGVDIEAFIRAIEAKLKEKNA